MATTYLFFAQRTVRCLLVKKRKEAVDKPLSVSQDEIEVTSINSGSSREYLPGTANGMLTVGGLSPIDNTEGKISIFYLLQQGIRQIGRASCRERVLRLV